MLIDQSHPPILRNILLFAHEIIYIYICMNTSSNSPESLILFRFIGIDFFFQPIEIALSCKVTIRKFKMLYFTNENRHETGNLKKDLFLGHLQRPINKNPEYLAVLI